MSVRLCITSLTDYQFDLANFSYMNDPVTIQVYISMKCIGLVFKIKMALML